MNILEQYWLRCSISSRGQLSETCFSVSLEPAVGTPPDFMNPKIAKASEFLGTLQIGICPFGAKTCKKVTPMRVPKVMESGCDALNLSTGTGPRARKSGSVCRGACVDWPLKTGWPQWRNWTDLPAAIRVSYVIRDSQESFPPLPIKSSLAPSAFSEMNFRLT
jgi:hypothetical protein